MENGKFQIEKYFFNVLHSGFWEHYFLRKCYIGMKNDAHKLSIVILQELVGKKLRIENGELKIENFGLRINDQRSSFLRFIFKNSEPII